MTVEPGQQGTKWRPKANCLHHSGFSRWRCLLLVLLIINVGAPVFGETWRGLVVSREHRCSPYDRRGDYSYSPSIELEFIRGLGAVYGPYTGTCFSSRRETDIEHIVAVSEAHDSGLCGRGRAERKRFASDIRNLTLASPNVNRYSKSNKDAAEWLPDRNRCWYAGKILEVRLAYDLTIDRREAFALERILSECENTELEPLTCHFNSERNEPASSSRFRKSDVAGTGGNALALYDDNRNGRITCKEARRHGMPPFRDPIQPIDICATETGTESFANDSLPRGKAPRQFAVARIPARQTIFRSGCPCVNSIEMPSCTCAHRHDKFRTVVANAWEQGEVRWMNELRVMRSIGFSGGFSTFSLHRCSWSGFETRLKYKEEVPSKFSGCFLHH